MTCPNCGAKVVRVQPAAPGRQPGIWAAVGCGCWLTPEQASALIRSS